MQYHKLTSGNLVIEFHNNWLGEETVIVNGQIVSKKSSILGTHHHFSVMEDGEEARYILTTKLFNGFQVALDLRRNGRLLQENVLVAYGSMPAKPHNEAKKRGLNKLQQYYLEEALAEFERALDLEADDPEIFFHMACAYSVMENAHAGFACLKEAVAKGLHDREMILDHDMLAYLRLRPAFEGFLDSGFTEYDEGLLGETDDSRED